MPSRRAEIAMSEEEIDEYLEGRHTLICATNGVRGWPHLMPLWYVRRDGKILVYTFGKSQKVQNILRDPRATLQIETGTGAKDVRGVMIEAEATVITDIEEVRAVGLEIYARYAGDEQGRIPDEMREALERQAPKRVVVAFEPLRTVSWDHAKLGDTPL